MTNKLPTYKQLERELSQKLRALYADEIDFPPEEIICKLFSRYVAIVSSGTLTPLEKSLWEQQSKQSLVEQVRWEIDCIIKPKLIQVVEDTIGVETKEVMGNVIFASNKSGALVVLAEPPHVRNPRHLPKLNR